MPVLANAKKALRSSQRKAAVNRRIISKMRTSITQFRNAPDQETIPAVFSAIDRAAKKNVIHPNKAARLKGQLHRLVQAS